MKPTQTSATVKPTAVQPQALAAPSLPAAPVALPVVVAPAAEAEVVAMVRLWTTELSGLKLMLVGMPERTTLDDALRAHRESTQAGRRPSRVMRADGD